MCAFCIHLQGDGLLKDAKLLQPGQPAWKPRLARLLASGGGNCCSHALRERPSRRLLAYCRTLVHTSAGRGTAGGQWCGSPFAATFLRHPIAFRNCLVPGRRATALDVSSHALKVHACATHNVCSVYTCPKYRVSVSSHACACDQFFLLHVLLTTDSTLKKNAHASSKASAPRIPTTMSIKPYLDRPPVAPTPGATGDRSLSSLCYRVHANGRFVPFASSHRSPRAPHSSAAHLSTSYTSGACMRRRLLTLLQFGCMHASTLTLSVAV